MNNFNDQIDFFCEQSQAVKEICDPLFEKFQFNFFGYQILYDDFYRIHLNANPEWLKNYYDKQHYNFSRSDKKPSSYINGYGIWDAWDKNDISALTIGKDAIENFDYAHGITFTKRFKSHTIIFEFATQLNNWKINNLYLSNIDLLQNFIVFFNEKTEKIIKKTNMHAFRLEKSSNDEVQDDMYSAKLVLPKNSKELFLYQPLTKQELVCVNWLIKGKTMKEMALILGISSRTVEKHIIHIKEKLHCYTLYQLGRKIGELGLERFLD